MRLFPTILLDRVMRASPPSCISVATAAPGRRPCWPRVATRDPARSRRCRPSGPPPPLTCERPCYPCSTLTHSNSPARAPARFLQYRAGLCSHLSKSGVHRSQAGTWVLASDGSAGRASSSRLVVSAKIYFTTGDDRRSARQGTSPQDPEKYIKAGRHNGEGR